MTGSLVGYDLGDDPDRGEATSCSRSPTATGPDGLLVHLRRADRGGGTASAGPPVVALLRAAGPHVEAVLDIGTAPNGDPVLVLPRLPWSLGELLAERRLSPGEVVTVLVPLIQTLGRLHAAGVTHGAVGPGTVRFDTAGTPTLTAFDDAVVAQGARDARFAAAVAADERALATLANALMRRGEAVAPALAADPDTAVRELFRWAEPEPVLLAGAASTTGRAPEQTPGRVIPPTEDPSTTPTATPAPPLPSPQRPEGRGDGDGDGGWTSRARTALSAALRRVIDPLRRVRPRLWLIAGTSVLLLAAATVLLPGRGAEAVGAPPRVTASSHSTPAVTPSARASSVPTAAVSGEAQPTRAATRLVALRAACLAAGDARCLRPLEVSGSPVAVLDGAALVAGVEAVRVPDATAVLRAVSGTTATVGIGRATVLIVRQGDDWLLRDVILPTG
ncbi:hypothetical protein [uncultured Amnibacterium sp.]|uniref:hypothetical protein n=1 Tax=uncultured Amnibacterium sp. TaxID=1631851 RepID=UPI0035CAE231